MRTILNRNDDLLTKAKAFVARETLTLTPQRGRGRPATWAAPATEIAPARNRVSARPEAADDHIQQADAPGAGAIQRPAS